MLLIANKAIFSLLDFLHSKSLMINDHILIKTDKDAKFILSKGIVSKFPF